MLVENFGVHWLRINLPFPCEIHWCRPVRMEVNENYKVLLINSEPLEFLIDVDELSKVYQYFDLIIAYHPRYSIFQNCVLRPFGCLYATKIPSRKEFSASFLFSIGSTRPKRTGYAERINLLNNLSLGAAMPLRVYKGRQYATDDRIPYPLLPDDTKNALFESMFHIAIENAFDEHYFSEKLMDCFATYTIPIYMGCPNIGDYFDVDGMILISPGDNVTEVLNRLTISDYWGRLESMAENSRRAQKYFAYLPACRSLILDAWRHRQK
jgi:hypothetical protein